MPQPSAQTIPTRSKPTAEGAYTDFMSRTYAMEHEATERYAQVAEELNATGNGECALLFRQLAEIEDRHATRILVKMGWTSLPLLPPAFDRDGSEVPETTMFDSARPLMQPRHALEMALRREVQAQKYFEDIASGGAPQRVRLAAAEMATEERAHARLIENWLARVPRGR
jgi:rubrerythrin